MSEPQLDDFMLSLAPHPPRPVAPALQVARKSVRAALADLVAVPDTAMERPWTWRGEEADVRYGFYRQYEALEDLRARLAPSLVEGARADSPARPLLGAATEARWDLHGLLAGLGDEDLDRDPGGGEWNVRQTLAHIVSGQRAYGWFTTWWVSRGDRSAEDLPARIPDDVAEAARLPEEETEGVGSLAEIGQRLDEIMDLSAGVFAMLDEEQLAARARWSGIPVDARFRVNRWSSHVREHTVQVEKTLVMIDRVPSEAARLARLVASAWGRLEADLYMWPVDAQAVGDGLGRAAEAATAVAADAQSIRQAAA